MQNELYDESLIDKLAAATEGGKDANPKFRYAFMVFNLYGVQLISEIHQGKTIENLFEEGSKTRALMHDMNTVAEMCLSGCGSIEGATIDKFLVKRAKVMQVGSPQVQQQQQSPWSKWFGGGNKDGKNTRDSSGF
jgi:hypothetical protein